mgnify:CR=1 FL=1
MTKIRLTKEFSFEAAHLLEGYDGACREIHGHSYRLFVTVKGCPADDDTNPKCGMVMDFGVLKSIVNEEVVSRFDHALVLRATRRDAPLRAVLAERFGNIVTVDALCAALWDGVLVGYENTLMVSRHASPAACPWGWNCIRSACMRLQPRSPSGSPRTICKKTSRDSGCGGFVKMAAAGQR